MPIPQKVDLYQILEHNRVGPAPLAIKTIITPNISEMLGGVPATTRKGETYVLLSALPEELRRRVELAIQALIAGM